MTDEIAVTRREKDFEITVDGAHAGLVTYHDRSGPAGVTRALPHTEIDDAYQGRGLAKILIQAALDQTRDAGLQVLPFCPAVRGFIAKNPEYVDLVPLDRRAEFDL